MLRTCSVLSVCVVAVWASPAGAQEDEHSRPGRKKAFSDEGDRRDERGDDDAEDGGRDKRERHRGEEDHARFRGGVRGEGGALIVPGVGEALPGFGVEGHIGAQIDDLIGVYWAPSFDIIVGSLGGVSLSSAILVDFTIDDTWQFGAGPDVGVFAAIGSTNTTGTAAGGALYGGRLHFAGFPLVGEGEDGVRRKGLSLGVDVRLLVGAVGIGTVNTNGSSSGAASDFVIAPIAFLGYEAF